MLSRTLLLTATVIGVASQLANAAVSRNALFRRSTPTSVNPECQKLIVGQEESDGTVCLTVDGDNLIVTYSPVTGLTYDEVHVWIGTEKPEETAPGQFPYTSNNGYCEILDSGASAECTIPLSELGDDLCSTPFYIASHAKLGEPTGWGKGECIKDGCAPWASYSPFEFEGCEENPPETSSVAPKETSTPEPAPTETPTETEPAPPATKTTTEVVTLTSTTCPVAEPCHPVTSETTITATLTATVTTPCETSTYVTSGSTCVTTITYAPVTTYATCPPSLTPSASPVYPPANVTAPTYAPAPTAFEGGSVSLGISLGSVVALVALFGGLLL